jgi:serine/threonine protein kinase
MHPPTENELETRVAGDPSRPTAEGPLFPGQIVAGMYAIEGLLGQGGMGVVFAARHQRLGHRVAIKVLRAEAAKHARAIERFSREAQAALALTSEHVVRVLDVGTLDDGIPYMVMEYLAGIDLANVLRRHGPTPVATAVTFMLHACEAVAEAHSCGIVHRDLKPANIFVTTRVDGSPLVKVLDFGISKAAPFDDGCLDLTATGVVIGSPAYMSPEQVRSAKEVDARGDVWSLGVILYELLTGASPFLGATLGETFAKILRDVPRPLCEWRSEIPPSLGSLVEQCLERSLQERVQSVAELASGLAEFAPAEAAPLVDRIRRLAALPRTSSTRQRTAPPAAPRSARPYEPLALPAPAPSASPRSIHGTLETASKESDGSVADGPPPWAQRSGTTELRILHREHGLVAAHFGAVCVAVWRENSTLARIERQRDALAHVVAGYPGEASFLCVVESTSAPPDEAGRRASSRMIEDLGANLRAVAIVIEGSGFRASIVRSVAAGIVLLARSKTKTPVAYFAGLEGGVSWLGRSANLGSERAIVRSVEELREHLKDAGMRA